MNKKCLRLALKDSTADALRTVMGRLFQSLGAATEKARSPYRVKVRGPGVNWRWAAALQILLMCCFILSLLSKLIPKFRTTLEGIISTPATSKLGKGEEYLNCDVMCSISVLD